jgi:hypothetical protein
MQDSLTSKLLSVSWDAIAKEVAGELADGGVADALRVVPRAIDEPGAWTPANIESPWGPVQVAEAWDRDGGYLLKIDSRYQLGLEDLRKPNFEEVARWARAMRRFEMTKVADALIAVGVPCPATVDALHEHLPEGLGAALLYWPPGLPNVNALKSPSWRDPKLIDASPDDSAPARGVLVCDDGGPVVRRDPDLELDWVPAGDGVQLVLRGRLQLRNANAATVTVLDISLPSG